MLYHIHYSHSLNKYTQSLRGYPKTGAEVKSRLSSLNALSHSSPQMKATNISLIPREGVSMVCKKYSEIRSLFFRQLPVADPWSVESAKSRFPSLSHDSIFCSALLGFHDLRNSVNGCVLPHSPFRSITEKKNKPFDHYSVGFSIYSNHFPHDAFFTATICTGTFIYSKVLHWPTITFRI